MRDHFDQTLRWFQAALCSDAPYELTPADSWTDDLWFLDQDDRELLPNEGWWPLQPGRASGRLVGGNLCTLNLLQGTPYLPSLDGALLVLEDDFSSRPADVARDLTSLLQVPDAEGVQGVVIGRFQRETGMTRGLLEQIVARQPGLAGLPVLANVDVGHTHPVATLPIGGRAELAVGEPSRLVVTEH